jgi:hypothetical protein
MLAKINYITYDNNIINYLQNNLYKERLFVSPTNRTKLELYNLNLTMSKSLPSTAENS